MLCAAIKNVVGEKSANKRAFIKLELYLPKSADSLRACESLVEELRREVEEDCNQMRMMLMIAKKRC